MVSESQTAAQDNDSPVDKLIFVYDAESGAVSAAIDSAKKLFKVGGCALCSITHGLTGEKSEWEDCKSQLGVPLDYVHRDELDGELEEIVRGKLPCVVAESPEGREIIMGEDVLERCSGSVGDFKGRLHSRCALHGLYIPEA